MSPVTRIFIYYILLAIAMFLIIRCWFLIQGFWYKQENRRNRVIKGNIAIIRLKEIRVIRAWDRLARKEK